MVNIRNETIQSVERALEAACLIIQNGGSTTAAERSLISILRGFKTEGVSVLWRLDFVAATRTTEGQSSVFMRAIEPIRANLGRASAITVFSERVAYGGVAIADLGPEFDRINQLSSPYSRWMLVGAAAFACASFSQIAGGDWGSFSIAFVAAASGEFFRSVLQMRKMAFAPQTLLCSLLSAMMAGIGLRLGFSRVAPATLIASVMYMIPGLLLINGFIDVASYKFLFVGLQRIANAALIFLILAVSIAIADFLVM